MALVLARALATKDALGADPSFSAELPCPFENSCLPGVGRGTQRLKFGTAIARVGTTAPALVSALLELICGKSRRRRPKYPAFQP